MTPQLAKWELKLLLLNKIKLRKKGRDTCYHDDNRMKQLRDFLDTQLPEKIELTENKQSEEIPF